MKMLNPFPIVELRSLAWEKGFFAGFCGALDRSSDIQPPDLDTADDIDAFNVGVIAGQQATILGWDILDRPCIEAGEATLLPEEDEWMEHTFTGAKLATELTVAVIKRSVVEGVVGGTVIGEPYASRGGVTIELGVVPKNWVIMSTAAGSWTTSTAPATSELAPKVGSVEVCSSEPEKAWKR